jgi:trans-2,3-dihydro-3-hydroxyanthranilate isomerase
MRYTFVTLDVFTTRRFGGNPLAVIPEAAGLSSEQMALIAREFNLSETAFVLPAQDPSHSHRVRIFTPSAELPFAGHPTLGTAFALAHLGQIPKATAQVIFEEEIGSVPIKLDWGSDGTLEAIQLTTPQLPQRGPAPPDPESLAVVLGIPVETIVTGSWRPQVWSCGVPFCVVAVTERQILRQLRLDLACWHDLLAPTGAAQIYCLWRDPAVMDLGHFRLAARMFAPGLGVMEDPATGSAAAALAGYLTAATGQVTYTCQIEQGSEIGRPSHLTLIATGSGDHLSCVQVAGSAVMVSQGWIEVEH